ncbi:hypothetical protein KA017_03435, partial [Candidatus Woesebacteria bacterium]|nr:hypothetical protein [Candidatus Woesebacteria bacterium]
NGVHVSHWPDFDAQKAKMDAITIPVQINGKVRASFVIPAEKVADEQFVVAMATALPELEKFIAGVEIKKKIYIAGKIVSLVV